MPKAFKALAELCEKLETTNKRLLMVEVVAEFLTSLKTEEVEPAVSMILGAPLPKWSQQKLDISWASLSKILKQVTRTDWAVFANAFSETGDVGSATKTLLETSRISKQSTLFGGRLTITEVRHNFRNIAETIGPGSKEKKLRLVESLLGLASPLEAKYLTRIFIGEMRTGFHEGLMERAVSMAFQIPLETVQNASMTLGDLGEVAAIARMHGERGLLKIGFRVFRPVRLMLAQMADGLSEIFKEHEGKTGLEHKLDGARVQIHKRGSRVRIFSRRLTDVTSSFPEIIQEIRDDVGAEEAILEGEVIAIDSEGRPIPFQHLMRRFRRVHAIENMTNKIPVELYLFDILYQNGKSLISKPYLERRQILAENVSEISLTEQLVTEKEEEAERFLKEAVDAGHEGIMAKRLDSGYTPGARGKNWLKLKPVLKPLDLVIVAAEYGYGRRHRWLSDYYLAARDVETGRFQMVGKTFKGLTDAEMIEMTKQLKELTVKEEHRQIIVIPKIVVEVTYNEIQESPKYECGMALRFARISRIREEKTPEEADTIQKVREIYERQFLKKGRYKPNNA